MYVCVCVCVCVRPHIHRCALMRCPSTYRRKRLDFWHAEIAPRIEEEHRRRPLACAVAENTRSERIGEDRRGAIAIEGAATGHTLLEQVGVTSA